MRWKDAAAALKRIAPAAAHAITGPAGGLIAAVVADKLGVEPTPTAVTRALQCDPEAAVKLAGIEAEIERARMGDLQHAREANQGHWMPPTLTLIYISLLVAVTGALLFLEIPGANRDIIFTIIGAIIARFTQGGDYWLGSSRGSADKGATLDAAFRAKE